MARASVDDRVAALLQEAAETHHVVYRITDGTDEDLGVLVLDLAARPVRTARRCSALDRYVAIWSMPSSSATTTSTWQHRTNRGHSSTRGH